MFNTTFEPDHEERKYYDYMSSISNPNNKRRRIISLKLEENTTPKNVIKWVTLVLALYHGLQLTFEALVVQHSRLLFASSASLVSPAASSALRQMNRLRAMNNPSQQNYLAYGNRPLLTAGQPPGIPPPVGYQPQARIQPQAYMSARSRSRSRRGMARRARRHSKRSYNYYNPYPVYNPYYPPAPVTYPSTSWGVSPVPNVMASTSYAGYSSPVQDYHWNGYGYFNYQNHGGQLHHSSRSRKHKNRAKRRRARAHGRRRHRRSRRKNHSMMRQPFPPQYPPHNLMQNHMQNPAIAMPSQQYSALSSDAMNSAVSINTARMNSLTSGAGVGGTDDICLLWLSTLDPLISNNMAICNYVRWSTISSIIVTSILVILAVIRFARQKDYPINFDLMIILISTLTGLLMFATAIVFTGGITMTCNTYGSGACSVVFTERWGRSLSDITRLSIFSWVVAVLAIFYPLIVYYNLAKKKFTAREWFFEKQPSVYAQEKSSVRATWAKPAATQETESIEHSQH